MKKFGREILKIHGISQNPDTNDYILVQNNFINFINWMSGNEKIDNFIQEMQLNINSHNDIVLEWIPYNYFNEIKETDKNGLTTVYSAIWRDGPLHYNNQYVKNSRKSNKAVTLKCLHNLQNLELLVNEV